MKQKPFASMKGGEMMEWVRDSLLEEAHRKQSFIDECEKYAGGVTPPEDRQRVKALEAAAEALQYAISLGKDERVRCEKDPSRRFPDWIWRMSNQMRSSLVEETPDVEDAPAG
jgi:hypothetical protein